MAIPILPLILLGVGAFALRRRRRPSKNKGTDETEPPIQTVVYVPPPVGEAPQGPSGEPGQPCDASDGQGAWDDLGHCKTFWIDEVTDEAIARLAREEWEARGQPGFSDLCLMVEDPVGGPLAAPKDNPRFVEIVSACLQRYYDVGALFPPTDVHGSNDPNSPYWVHEAWARANTVVRKELCGL